MSLKLELVFLTLIVMLLTAVGCHRLECADDADCPERWTCVGSSLCPDDVVCIWEGEPGLCLPIDEQRLCEHTGGDWDEVSCGHYQCGEFPACDAIIPGCNCGPDSNFVELRGCVEDIACTGGCYSDEDCEGDLVCHGARLAPDHPDHPALGKLPICMWGHDRPGECVEPEVALCERSGGTWDETSCGDYSCGQPPLCEAIIPGCDCGPMANYVEGEGCVKDRDCLGVCETDEDCAEGEICKHRMVPMDDMSTDAALGCTPEECGLGMCVDADIDLCKRTGGSWDEMRCGHSSCQSDNTCLAIIPGCDCGPSSSWVEGEGCVLDPACEPIKCSAEHPCPDGMTCWMSRPTERETTGDSVFLSAGDPASEGGICRPAPLPM